jgi:hypothetical protein
MVMVVWEVVAMATMVVTQIMMKVILIQTHFQ